MSTILIVDDEFSIAETVADILSWEGYSTVTAANGELALAQIEKKRPDLILLDYMMPVMDGLQMLRALRANPELRSIPVVIMTAAPPGLGREDRLWNGLLSKPFDAEQLLRQVRKLLPR